MSNEDRYVIDVGDDVPDFRLSHRERAIEELDRTVDDSRPTRAEAEADELGTRWSSTLPLPSDYDPELG